MDTINCKVCGKEIPDNEMGTCDECHEKIMARIESKQKEENVEKVENNKEKLKEETKTKSKDIIHPIFTSRVLFISILDKIFIITFLFLFIIRTFYVFYGNMSSLYYNYFTRLGFSFLNIIFMVILGLIMYLIYLCAARTMLCITEKQVYGELYFPFFEKHTSIPLEKITKVENFEFFFIFRAVIIYQYNKLPLIFFTWTSKEFKSNLNKKLKIDHKEIENEVQFKNLFSKKNIRKIIILSIIYIVIIAIIGLASLVGYLTCEDRQILGNFISENSNIQIQADGVCMVNNIGEKDGYNYEWIYDSYSNELQITYKTLEKYTYSNSKYEATHYLTFEFNSKEKTLSNDEYVFIKSK